MLTKRIIPCLDVKNNRVVKGVKFREHQIIGDIVELAQYYCDQGADELVFYDITASSDKRVVASYWINEVAKSIDIPFCVAGGIRSLQNAEDILKAGADKISINSPALENPNFINQLAKQFGSQCVVVGIDSYQKNHHYYVYQYTGDESKTVNTKKLTQNWLIEVQQRGAGEIVLNCMNQDGMRNGYDLEQLKIMRDVCHVPLIASGGAGCSAHFSSVFQDTQVDGALAASVFHHKYLLIKDLKHNLAQQNIAIRP